MSILHSPISLRSLQLKNRLVLPPMATAKCGDSGAVTDALCEYYDEKTKGGMIGLVITEHCFISPEGKAGAGQMSIASDDLIPGLKKLTDVIHANGSPVIAQINHAGISAKSEITGLPVIGPSSLPHPTRPAADVLPVEMTLEDIERVKEAFVKAALRAKEAGFDGVEIHSAHSYLLNQFYSPLTNHRTDAYGGSLENRIRLHLEIIEAVREAVGKSYIIAIRLGGCDYMEGGSTIEEAAAACKAFALASADLLDISGGFCSYRHPTSTEPGYFKDMTLAVKKACPKTPVILTGGITTGEQAEALLQEYVADMIGVGRAILQDSDWAKKNM